MKANIKSFDNLLQYREWLNFTMDNLKINDLTHYKEYFSEETVNKTISSDGESWYGKGIRYADLINGITEYRNHDLLERLFNEVSDGISLDIKNTLKSKKMKYNAYGLGMFSFDRAAMGFYRIKEFYSVKHKRKVSHNEVYKKANSYYLSSDNTSVIERVEETIDGRPKYRTTSKKLYSYFPKINKEFKNVEILVTSGGPSYMPAERFLYSGISAVIVARLLELAKIKTKISVLFGSYARNGKNLYACSIPVKNYNETLDINLIALLTSDPAIERFDGFKGTVAAYEHFRAKCPRGFGFPFDKSILRASLAHTIPEENAFRLFFGGTFSEGSAILDIKNAIEEIQNKFHQQ